MTVLRIYTLGGTLAGVADENENRAAYADRNLVKEYIQKNYPDLEFELVEVCNKDSKEITDEDLRELIKMVNESPHERQVIFQGSDTAIVTGRWLKEHVEDTDKTVLVSGGFSVLSEKRTATRANVDSCLTGLHPKGTWLIFEGGQRFDPDLVDKNFKVSDVQQEMGRIVKSSGRLSDEYYRKEGPAKGQQAAGSKSTYIV